MGTYFEQNGWQSLIILQTEEYRTIVLFTSETRTLKI